MTDIATFLAWVVDVTRIPERHLQENPEVYGRFLPYWAGWLLAKVHIHAPCWGACLSADGALPDGVDRRPRMARLHRGMRMAP